MFKITKVAFVAAISLSMVALGVSASHANIRPTAGGVPVSVVEVGGVWQYTYNIEVDDEQQVSPGSFFTFYDFGGYVDGSATFSSPFAWTVSTAGTTPNPVVPAVGSGSLLLNRIPGSNGDFDFITNVTFSYAGTEVVPGAPQGNLAVPLGTFTLSSIYGPGSNTNRIFAGQGYIRGTGNPGDANANVTTYVAPSAIPEPSEYAFMAFAGASLCGLVVRARRRKAAAAA